MKSFLCFVFLVCVVAIVHSFPSLHFERREEAVPSDEGYVVYKQKKLCMASPRNMICDIDYEIPSYLEKVLASLNDSISIAHRSLGTVSPPCADAYKAYMCQRTFPQCIPGGYLDYGDEDKAADEVEESCKNHFPSEVISNLIQRDGHHSGRQRNPLVLRCKHIPQDQEKICPKPQYKVPVHYVEKYEAQIHQVVKDMSEDRTDIPDECFNLGVKIFGCSYAFCSDDGLSVLMTMTQQKCYDSLKECFQKNDKFDVKIEEKLRGGCKGYPDEKKADKESLPKH